MVGLWRRCGPDPRLILVQDLLRLSGDRNALAAPKPGQNNQGRWSPQEIVTDFFRREQMMRMRTFALVAVLLLAAGMTSPPAADAQITRGAISGTVKDQTGAIIPGATVTVTNVDTNASRTSVTDAQGFYRAAAIEPGRYQVVTELAGFGTVENKDIVVVAASEVAIDVVLKPAGVGEAITVTAEAPTAELNKTSGTLSAVPQQPERSRSCRFPAGATSTT